MYRPLSEKIEASKVYRKKMNVTIPSVKQFVYHLKDVAIACIYYLIRNMQSRKYWKY